MLVLSVLFKTSLVFNVYCYNILLTAFFYVFLLGKAVQIAPLSSVVVIPF